MSFTLDPELRRFATDSQWQKLEALAQHGTQRAAAAALGITKTAVCSAHHAVLARAAQHGYSPDHDMVHQLPDGYKLRGTSTLYDSKTGEPKIQWVKSEVDKERQKEIFDAIIAGLSDEIQPVKPIPYDQEQYPHICTDLMACYPVGDHHLGMLAWHKETGANYDLKIGEDLLAKAADYLVTSAPACRQALVVFLGDFMHYDSLIPETPAGHNKLDSDSRPAKMVRVAVRSMRYVVTAALTRHETVHVIAEPGNHDPYSTIFLVECLRVLYENEPRVTVDDSPSHYHYFKFGKNLIGVHHGHDTKMQNLPLIMAADKPEWWGETDHRTWWTGHIHHNKTQAAVSAQDYTGCTVESFQILPPADAWAQQKGYRAKRSMKSIILHREHGEVGRNTVNPAMF